MEELLLAGEPSHRRLLAMEFDSDEVTTAIAARRPPLEESILRARRAAIVPLSVLGTARQLVGKITGRALARLVIENAIAAWHRDAALASELRLPADAAARLRTLMWATRAREDSMKVPEEQSCWYQLNQVLTGERVFDLAGAVELLNEGGTAAEVSELIVDTLDVAQSGMAAPTQVQIRPKVIESNDPEKALAELLELCAAHNPMQRKRCEGLKRELDIAFGSSDPLPDHLFQQVANVFGDNGPAYVIWWLELLLARSLCRFVRQVAPFFQAAGSNVLLLVDAVRTLKSGAAEPSVKKLLQSFELPGVSMGSFNWVNAALEISQHHRTFLFCIEFAHERENLMRREPTRESLEVHRVDLIENGRPDLSNNHVLRRRNAQRALPPAGFLEYRQPRLPPRNSGSTPACTGNVSTAPAPSANSCATSRSSKPSLQPQTHSVGAAPARPATNTNR
ncbi:MAG: hypothetical protein ABSH45_16185 [Bryobacteraceae bacterium]